MKARKWVTKVVLSLALLAVVWPASGCRRGYRGGNYTDVSVGLGFLDFGGYDFGGWDFWSDEEVYYDEGYYDSGYYEDEYYYEDGYGWYDDGWKKKNGGAQVGMKKP